MRRQLLHTLPVPVKTCFQVEKGHARDSIVKTGQPVRHAAGKASPLAITCI